MSDTFDPYRKWLGIHAAEQPAHHYRLLAIGLFEDDPDVIEAAADQRMAHVRTFQTGKHSALSQRILNELTAAKLCLMDPKKRDAYDDELRLRLNPPPATNSVAAPVAALIEQPFIPVADRIEPPSVFVVSSEPKRAARKSRRRVGPIASAWLALAVVAVPATAFIGNLIWTTYRERQTLQSRPERNTVSRKTKPEPERTPPSKPPVPPTVAVARTTEPPLKVIGGVADNAKRFAFDIPDSHRARWWLDGNELVQSSLDENLSIIFGHSNWDDVDYSVEAQRTEGNDTCGLWCRYENGGNAAIYHAAGNANTSHIAAITDNAVPTTAASCPGSLVNGRWYRLEFRMRGTHGECFLDGQSILRFESPRRGHGRVGLLTWGSAYRFRNILVKAPDGRLLLEGLPDLDKEPQKRPLAQAEAPAPRGGTLPTAADGRALNLGFEAGSLQDWIVMGEGFGGQPAKGDTLHDRFKYLKSGHAGQFWLSGWGRTGDAAKGILTSVPFKVTHPYASFLVAGRPEVNAAVDIVARDGNTLLFRGVGDGSDTLQPVAVDLSGYLGKEVFIRIADYSAGGKGRVSFDDFRFHAAQPYFPPPYRSAATLTAGAAIDLMKLVDIGRDARGGAWYYDDFNHLVAPTWGWKMLQVPLAGLGEYDMAFTLEGFPRIEGIYVILVIGGRQVLLKIDQGKSITGLAKVDGKAAHENESTHHGAVLIDGQPNKLVCQVRTASIKVICNGTAVIDWRGNPSRLSFPWGAVGGFNDLLIGGFRTGFRLSQIELTPIGAQPAAQSTAGANAPAKPAETTDKPRSLADLAKEKEPAGKHRIVATETATLKLHTGAVRRVAFHHSPAYLLSAGNDGRVVVWNVANRVMQSELHNFPDKAPWAIAVSPSDGVIALASRDRRASTLLFKAVTGQQLGAVTDIKSGAIASMAFSTDGHLLAVGQDDGTLRVWLTSQPQAFGTVALGDGNNVNALAFGAGDLDRKRKSGRYLLAAGGRDGVIRTFTVDVDAKTATGAMRATGVGFPTGGAVLSIRFSPDKSRLGCSRLGGRISLYDPYTGESIRELAPGLQGNHPVEWIAFHPSRPWCMTAHREGAVARIWNTDTAELLCELKGHTGGVLCAEFSPFGLVATASEDASVKLWEVTESR